MRAVPCNRNTPPPKQRRAARNLAAVPAFPTNKSNGFPAVPPLGICPAKPRTRMVRLQASFSSGSKSMIKPNCRNAAVMICVSSLHSAPRKVIGPFASAARIRARLVMLLEPGTVMTAETGASNGVISMTSGSAMSSPAAHSSEAAECPCH